MENEMNYKHKLDDDLRELFTEKLKFGNGVGFDYVVFNSEAVTDYRFNVNRPPSERFKYALVDFDGVVTVNSLYVSNLVYNQGIKEILLYLLSANCIPVLWTARSNSHPNPQYRVNVCWDFINEHNLPLISIERYRQLSGCTTEKPLVDLVIDDLAVGVPVYWYDCVHYHSSERVYATLDCECMMGLLAERMPV
jgi:hypothetical protein